MSSSFWAVNLKGIEGLFSGVLRCTLRESLRAGVVTAKDRHWVRCSGRRARGALRQRNGVSFEAIVCVERVRELEWRWMATSDAASREASS